jgi:Uncharacterized conserved protein (DUF2278)
MARLKILICLTIISAIFFTSPVNAELDSYGIVVGTVVYDNITDISTTKSPHLEPQQEEGKYPHYMFYVDTPSGRYQCVIDIFSRLNNDVDKSINYRLVPLRTDDNYWDSVLNLSNGYYDIPRDSNHGALDYYRHPGINKDAMTYPWLWEEHFVVGVNLPTFDNIFKNVRRIWVFGQPYSVGLGIHNIHQNQGNVPGYVPQAPQGSDGVDHSPANGLWQDGGVILEYEPVWVWVPRPRVITYPTKRWWLPCETCNMFINGYFKKVPNRKLLMTQFQVQEDFTFDTAASQDGYNFDAGDGYAPLYLYDYKISSTGYITAGGQPMEGQHSSVSGMTKKIRILVTPLSGHPVLYGRIGSEPTKTQYDAKSDKPVGSVETIHAYSPSPQKWYWRVFNNGSEPCSFNWEEFDDNF